jgi:hypothetical protein
MALSPTLAPVARLVEKEVTLATSGTGTVVTAIDLDANTMVLAGGLIVTEAAAGSTAHTFDLSVGSQDLVTAVVFQGKAVGAVVTEACVPILVGSSDDTLDVVSTVTGTGTAGKARVWALVADATVPRAAAEVDRDTLA